MEHDTPDLFPALHNPSIVAEALCWRREEGCPFHQPALLLQAHARATGLLLAWLLLNHHLCTAGTSAGPEETDKSFRNTPPGGGLSRCEKEPGSACCLSVGFHLLSQWKLAHQLVLEPVDPSRLICGGSLRIYCLDNCLKE